MADDKLPFWQDILSRSDIATRSIQGVVALVSALTLAMNTAGTNPHLFAAAVIGLGVASVWWTIGHYLRRRRPKQVVLTDQRRSTYLRSLLPFEENEKLLGRDQEIGQLIVRVRSLEFQFGYLSGEAGAGKTSILRAGLLPELKKAEWLPIYVARTRGDPKTALQRELQSHLSLADAEAAALSFQELIRRVATTTSHKPIVVIFDQFEEFFIYNRSSDTRASFEELLRDIQALIANRIAIRVLFSLRKEFVDDLLDFSKVIPDLQGAQWRQPLRNFMRDTAVAVLRKVVEDEKLGFSDELQELVISDLARDERVRPVEFQLVLTKLLEQGIFDIGAYRGLGGAHGVIARFVRETINPSEMKLQELDKFVARQLLRDLCNNEFTTRRPVGLSHTELLDRLSVEARLSQLSASRAEIDTALGGALARLLHGYILIREDEDRYNLTHDYLASPVRDATTDTETVEERANQLLETYLAQSRTDKKIVLPWRTLLFTRKFAARDLLSRTDTSALISRSFMHHGLIATGAVAATGALLALVWVAREYYETGSNIKAQLARIDRYSLDEDAAAGLEELTRGSVVTRWRVTSDIFSAPDSARWFNKNPGPILRALVRLDPSRLNGLIRAHVTSGALQQADPALREATGWLVRATSFAALADDTKNRFKQALTESLRGNSNDIDLAVIAVGVRKVTTELENDDPLMTQWLAALRDRIETSTGTEQLQHLVVAYAAVATKLKEGDPRAKEEVAALLGAIGRTTDPYQLSAFSGAYAAVAVKLKEDDPHAAIVFAKLRDAIANTTDRSQLELLEGYTGVAALLKEGDPRAKEEVAALLGAIGRTTDPYQLSAFSRAYAAVAVKLKEDDPHAAIVFAKLRDAIANTTDRSQLVPLVWGYTGVAALLKEGDPRAKEEVAALRCAIDKTLAGDQLGALASALAEASTKLGGDSRAADVIAPLLRDAITRDPDRLGHLARNYAEVSTKLGGDPSAADLVAALGDAIRKNPSVSLALAYADVATQLKQGDPRAGEEVAMLGDAVRTSVFPRRDLLPLIAGGRSAGVVLSELVQAYVAVAAKLNEDDPRVVAEVDALQHQIDTIRDTMGAGTGQELDLPKYLAAAAQAYAAVASKVKKRDPHRVASVFAALRDAIGKAPSYLLPDLAKAYEAVASKLKGADLRNEVNALRDAISNTTDSNRLGALAQAYAAAAKADRQAIVPERDLAVLVNRMRLLRYPNDCQAFVAAIKEATQLGLPRMSWEKAGLVVTAALLEPAFSGIAVSYQGRRQPAHDLVMDYKETISQHPNAPKLVKSWSDVWEFTTWARDHLPGFDPQRPNVGFLPH